MSRTFTRELIAASSEPMILGILRRGENYGYAIIQQVRLSSGGQMEWTDGMLYPVLHRLEIGGCVASRWGEGGRGPRRKYYRLTAKGRKRLERLQEEWRSVHETLHTILASCST